MNPKNKITKRLSLIAVTSLSSIAVPAVNMVFSLIVVRMIGADAWGGFVYYFLWSSLASFVMNWGNKDYLLREFASNASLISSSWRESFFTRSLLIIPCFVVFIIAFPLPQTLLLLQWTLLLFIAQSFDVFTAYYRKFAHAFAIEITAGIFLAAFIVFRTGLDLFTIYLMYLCIRIILYLALFRSSVFKDFDISIKFSLLKGSMMFFLLGLTGLIGSRIDQYCVSLMLPVEDLGKYNILRNILIYTHAGIGFILLPYVKNIYRMKDEAIDKIANRMFLSGAIFIIPYTVLLYLVVNYIYGIEFSYTVYVYGSLIVLPSAYYATIIYKFFKYNRQKIVLWIGVITIITSASLNILLIPKLLIEGSLIAGIISQWITLLLIFYLRKK